MQKTTAGDNKYIQIMQRNQWGIVAIALLIAMILYYITGGNGIFTGIVTVIIAGLATFNIYRIIKTAKNEREKHIGIVIIGVAVIFMISIYCAVRYWLVPDPVTPPPIDLFSK